MADTPAYIQESDSGNANYSGLNILNALKENSASTKPFKGFVLNKRNNYR